MHQQKPTSQPTPAATPTLTPTTKTHKIHKQKSKTEVSPEKVCDKFKINPPIMNKPVIRVKNKMSKFKISVKEMKMDKFQVRVYTSLKQIGEIQDKKLKGKWKQKLMEYSNQRMGERDGIDEESMITVSESELFQKRQDLSIYSLHQIISTFFSEGLMLQYYFSIFAQNFDESDETKLLQTYERQMQEKNFRKALFTLIDHRIFSECLVTCCGNRYYIGEIQSSQIGPTWDYYRKMYNLSIADYLQQWDKFNKDYNRYWMPKSVQLLKNLEYFREKHDFL